MKPRPLRTILVGLTLLGGAKTATLAPLPTNLTTPILAAVVGTAATALPAMAAADDEATVAPIDAGSASGAGGTVCKAPAAVLDLLARERMALEEDRAALEAERADLAATRIAIEASAAELAALRGELEGLRRAVADEHEADLDRLVNLYRGMKPAQAAAIVSDLDLNVTMALFGRMPERDAAPILAQLNPILAGAISRVLLERGKLPADQDLSGLRVP